MKRPTKRPSNPQRAGPPPIFVVMVILGVVAVFFSLVLTVNTKKLLAASRQVRGTVVRVKPASSAGGSQTYYPVFSAEDDDGQTFEITGSVSYNPPPTIGGEVTLAYPSGRPREAFVVGLLGIWFLPVFIGGFGAVLTTLGFLLLFVTGRPPPSQPKAAPPRTRKGAKPQH